MLPHLSFIGHSFQSPDADIIVKKFIERMSESIKNEMTGHLFAEIFEFKVCNRTYDKSETLVKMAQVPKEANFNFALKSANWNKEGQIEYTVTISGALLDDFDAQFVYCPYLQVLKSGSIPSCPAKRTLAKPCLDDLGLFC
ncbi:hypothetical protein CAEBREN_02838 [Caenorhabditis brenneri]|uniref:NTF2-like domain-containing protein n=1 Tax=Caenorhabditis brenneri TaxID=135651 RepID=G0MNY7_CAEBE|nr:hypothetical protein CAEBREN_02838 [Caenorhabditis brenneri]